MRKKARETRLEKLSKFKQKTATSFPEKISGMCLNDTFIHSSSERGRTGSTRVAKGGHDGHRRQQWPRAFMPHSAE